MGMEMLTSFPVAILFDFDKIFMFSYRLEFVFSVGCNPCIHTGSMEKYLTITLPLKNSW
jgi:hypothetical protein